MGFNSVYKSLVELFPQIDSRALRAVAIEHSKDADAAVEAVLEEIIPFFTEISRPNSPLTVPILIGESSKGPVDCTTTMQTVNDPPINTLGVEEKFVNTVHDENNPSFYGNYIAHDENNVSFYGNNVVLAHHENNAPFYGNYVVHHEGEGSSTAELTWSGICGENNTEISSDVHFHDENIKLIDGNGENTLHPDKMETVLGDTFPESSIDTSTNEILPPTDGNLQVVDNQKVNLISGMEEFDGTMSSSENNFQLVVVPDMIGSNFEKLEESVPIDTASKMETTRDADVSQSDQTHGIEVLEEIIADARNNKKTLFSAMESVINTMREVELKEQAAEQLKEEATRGGEKVMDRVEELKQMLKHAKEANDMHAGEVYGEKAILATELRELWSRALSLSDERDKSLEVLDQMRQTLELRLAAAENEMEIAEREKLENETSARKALAEQELIMEHVVQESNILKQQAEENAKLREFLVDRGSVVDMLQGEIAVICQDVKLLKQKFDDGVPLGKSFSSGQTSFILASSTSSFKSLIPDQIEPGLDPTDSSLTQKPTGSISQIDPTDSSVTQKATAPISQDTAEEEASSDRRALLDEGWEIFDKFENDD